MYLTCRRLVGRCNNKIIQYLSCYCVTVLKTGSRHEAREASHNCSWKDTDEYCSAGFWASKVYLGKKKKWGYVVGKPFLIHSSETCNTITLVESIPACMILVCGMKPHNGEVGAPTSWNLLQKEDIWNARLETLQIKVPRELSSPSCKQGHRKCMSSD